MTGFFNGGGATLTFGDTRDPNSFVQFGNRWRGGQIVDIGNIMPQTNMQTKEPLMRNGKPLEQLPVTLLCDGSGPAAERGLNTNERNPQDHADTGRRVWYVKGTARFSLGDALRAVGADDIEVGGYIFMMWTGMGKSGNSDYIGRTWQIHYIKPSGAFLAQQAANSMQSAPQGAMPVQQNAAGQFAPQHTGFAPTPTPSTAPPQQGWSPAQSAPVAPPNPYEAPQSVQQHYAPTQQQGGAFPAQPPQAPVPGPQSAAPAPNPWGQGSDTPAAPPTPYGPPEGAPVAPPAGNPWLQ